MGNYDKIMRGNLSSKRLLEGFLPFEIQKVAPLPPRIRKTVLEKETDNLFLIETGSEKQFILHLEFQSTNDNQMALRMAAYDYAIYYNYQKEVISAVIYIGNEKMTMPNK